MPAWAWIVTLIVTNVAVCRSVKGSIEDESYLQSHLLVNYSSNVRPSQQVEVTLGMSLNNIIELNIVDQVMTVSGSMIVSWMDDRLEWEPKDYRGTTELYFTVDEIWRPLLVLRNAADEIMAIGDVNSQRSIRIVATHDGRMTWAAPAFFKALCSVDVSLFPFDTQTCELEISSWMFANDKVNFSAVSEEMKLATYAENGEYILARTYVDIRNEVIFGVTPWSLAVFGIELRRRNSYYVINIVLPVLCLQVLGVVVFMVPAASGEKLSYALTLLLSQIVMTTMVAENIPSTSMQVSLISIYVLEGVIMSVLELIFTVYILNLNRWHEEDRTPGPGHRLLGATLTSRCFFRSNRNKIHGEEDLTSEMTVQDIIPEKPMPEFESQDAQPHDRSQVVTAAKEGSSQNDVTASFKDIADALEKTCFVVFSLLTLVCIAYACITIATG